MEEILHHDGPWFITKDWTSWMNCRAAVRCSWSFWRATRPEWSPENIIASFTEADKPTSLASKTTTDEENEMNFNPDLVQRRSLMRRQPIWPWTWIDHKNLSTSFVCGSFLQDDVSKDWSWWKSKDLFRSITSMTSSICERCRKHDICHRIPKCWPWEDACAASCRSMGECPRCKSWLFQTVRDRRKIKRWEIWTIYKHDILSAVLIRPIQLVSMRFSFYFQNVKEKSPAFCCSKSTIEFHLFTAFQAEMPDLELSRRFF